MVYQLPIIERKEVAENTKEVVFGADGNNLEFKPGQHMNLILPELNFPDPKGSSRYFSVVSTPNNKDSVSIVFRNSDSGFKKTLLGLPLGTKVGVDCCHGSFLVPEANTHPLVLIAGGVGIAPCISIIRSAIAQQSPYQITLLYGSHNEASAAYLTELKELSLSQNANRTIATLSVSSASPEILAKEEWVNRVNALTLAGQTALAETPIWSTVIDEVDARVIDGISISTFRAPSITENMSLAGTAKDRTTLNQFKKSLQESTMLTGVELPITNIEKKEDVPFTVSFRMKDPSVALYK